MAVASYLSLFRSGELARRAGRAAAMLSDCRMCPRACGVDRASGDVGFCGVGRRAVVASYNGHFGEEAPLVGEHGSGTIFFAGCTLGCAFCQNHDISQPESMADAGIEASPEELAGVMLELERQGCHNINLVTPSHVVAQILEALAIACDHGLSVPLVYNSSAYDSVGTLSLLEGVVDIYMPDAKIWDPDLAGAYLKAREYPDAARAAIAEMHRQVGDLVLDGRGLATRGLLVRHLVMPDGAAGTESWMCWLSGEVSARTYVNVMDQYRPCGDAHEIASLGRAITAEEYREALNMARKCSITRFDEPSVSRFSRRAEHLR